MAKKLLACTIVCAVSFAFPQQAEARDRLLVVGSSTVFPFAMAVAEKFGKNGTKHPVVESTGSGGGFDLFCRGVGLDTPDISNASRRIKQSELDKCSANGVTPIEVEIGYDGIVLANSTKGPRFSLTIDQVFQALGEKLPVDGQLVDNPNKRWSDIDPVLPDEKIQVLGPPPTSGTRDAFEELVMEEGCEAVPELERSACTDIRRDGSFIEAGENDDLIAGALQANPSTFGIFGYSFLAKNPTSIQGVGVNGVEPTFDNIASGKYPVSRPLFFYIKAEHLGLVPGIGEYVGEFTSEAAWGDEGYLPKIGLIPLAHDARRKQAERLVRLISE